VSERDINSKLSETVWDCKLSSIGLVEGFGCDMSMICVWIVCAHKQIYYFSANANFSNEFLTTFTQWMSATQIGSKCV